MQSRIVPFSAVGKGGGCQKGVARVVHPSLKPVSAEAERKRTRGKGGGGGGEVGMKKIKGSGWDGKQMCERI